MVGMAFDIIADQCSACEGHLPSPEASVHGKTTVSMIGSRSHPRYGLRSSKAEYASDFSQISALLCVAVQAKHN